MHHLPTTLAIVALAVTATAAAGLSLRRLFGEPREPQVRALEPILSGLIAAGCGGVFIWRWLVVQKAWVPLEAHVDGLLLIGTLLALMVAYLQTRSRMIGLGAFALPVLAILLVWAICASVWTLQPFDIHSAWRVLHLGSVYLGTLFLATAAGAGGLFLYVRRRLQTRRSLSGLSRLASLEATERLIIRASTVGFVLLTIALATGLVTVTAETTRLGPGWWYSPKVVLAFAAWAVFALVMNVRYASRFRGSRAAWLAILGLVLLLGALAATTALPPLPTADMPAATSTEEEAA